MKNKYKDKILIETSIVRYSGIDVLEKVRVESGPGFFVRSEIICPSGSEFWWSRHRNNQLLVKIIFFKSIRQIRYFLLSDDFFRFSIKQGFDLMNNVCSGQY
jgi:hypothetical protein